VFLISEILIFNEILQPKDTQVALKAIHMSKTLTYEQKNEQIKAIFDKLPKEALYQLPYPALPQGFEVNFSVSNVMPLSNFAR
jgi:hypothetical protein